MNSMAFRFHAGLLLVATVSLSSPSARADVTKDQCVDSNAKAQDLRRNGKLLAARAELRTCSDPSCPAMVRDDCTKRLDEVDRAQPAIVFDVRDAAGHDVSAVSVTMDGHPLATKLDGTPLSIDPGEHAFAFAVPDQPPVTQTFILREGDKERRERVVVGAALPGASVVPASAQGSSSATTPSAAESSGGKSTQKVLGLVVGGAGVAGVAVGAIFGVMTLSQVSQQKTDCASSTQCPHPAEAASDHSSAGTDRTISTIGFIGGGALLVAGAVLFFTAPHSSETAATARLTVLPTVGPGGGGMMLQRAF